MKTKIATVKIEFCARCYRKGVFVCICCEQDYWIEVSEKADDNGALLIFVSSVVAVMCVAFLVVFFIVHTNQPDPFKCEVGCTPEQKAPNLKPAFILEVR